MWTGVVPPNPYGPAGGQPQQAQPAQQLQQGQQQQQQQKHDIFVGNLAFNTTEEQIHQSFSELGRVVKVRMVNDLDTGKPRGFAFVEFEDPQAALSAIRNMNDYELNGRRIRVNFSNSSHLEALAGKLGMEMPALSTSASAQSAIAKQTSAGTNAVADALKGMSKGEMYDVVEKLKEIADRDPDEARRILSGHPQLPEAMLHLMSKLDMIQTPLPIMQQMAPSITVPPPAPLAVDPRARADPRAPTRQDPRAAAVPVAAPQDPRARAPDPRATVVDTRATIDPRASVDPRATVDPRARMQVPPPPPPPQQYQQPQYVMPPPPQPPAALDPNLVQQVMSLTPQQIAQLPPDKQQSILALRQQITGGR